MSCTQCQGIQSFFNERTAARELKRYRKRGAPKATKRLIEAIAAEGIEGASLLDIGGGVGIIQHELLGAGAARAVGVDASTAYVEAAREEAERQGHSDKVNFCEGDFVVVAPELEPADIATLDKVICCYPDMETLVTLSVDRANRIYGLVYPRETRLIRLGFGLINLFMRLTRSSFRAFVHPPAAVDRIVRAHGFTERFKGRAEFVWEVVVYGRS